MVSKIFYSKWKKKLVKQSLHTSLYFATQRLVLEFRFKIGPYRKCRYLLCDNSLILLIGLELNLMRMFLRMSLNRTQSFGMFEFRAHLNHI